MSTMIETVKSYKAIETRYGGCRFRSRLEARWAVFFDAVRIPWEYEPEGFELDSGRYLPDFFLPRQECWLEIKGRTATDRELRLAAELAEASSLPVYLFETGFSSSGCFGVPEAQYLCGLFKCPDGTTVESGDSGYMWCQCRACGYLGIEFNGRSNRLPCKRKGCPRDLGHEDKGYNYDAPSIIRAYAAAKSARFEFGR
jgi:hypothetical protein